MGMTTGFPIVLFRSNFIEDFQAQTGKALLRIWGKRKMAQSGGLEPPIL